MVSSFVFLFLDSLLTCCETSEKKSLFFAGICSGRYMFATPVGPNCKDLESDGTGSMGRIVQVKCSLSRLNIQLHKCNVIDKSVSCNSFVLAKTGCYHRKMKDSILDWNSHKIHKYQRNLYHLKQHKQLEWLINRIYTKENWYSSW